MLLFRFISRIIAVILLSAFYSSLFIDMTIKHINETANKIAEIRARELVDQEFCRKVKLCSESMTHQILSQKILVKDLPAHKNGYSSPQLKRGQEYTILVEATAYWVMDPEEASGDGIAFDGTPAIPYRTIAVDPKVIPLQSEVYVPTIGWCRANDTGNAIKGNIIDISMESRRAAWNWGRRLVEVRVRPPV